MIPLPCWRKRSATTASMKMIVTEDGDYGQVLLSRWPFAEPPKIPSLLSGARAAPRHCRAHVLTSGEVKVVATHLGLSIHERHAQAHALAGLVSGRECWCSAISTTGSR